MQAEERVDTLELTVLLQEQGDVLSDVQEVVYNLRMREVFLRIVQHVPRHIRRYNSLARKTSWEQLLPGEISNAAANVQELLVICRSGVEAQL